MFVGGLWGQEFFPVVRDYFIVVLIPHGSPPLKFPSPLGEGIGVRLWG